MQELELKLDKSKCGGVAGMLEWEVWSASEYVGLKGCAALLDVLSVVGAQWSQF